MRAHIDWITFTGNPLYNDKADFPRAVLNGLHLIIGSGLMADLLAGAEQQREKSRAPYTYAWEWKASSVIIFASETLNHFTVEISGQGCERLIDMGLMESLIERVADRVTRVDVACDIETPVKPLEFVEQVKHDRMRSSGYQRSESGETCYVGSQKSERYARVYRYNKPHPRSHLLRIEHVFRRDHAKVVAGQIAASGVVAVADAAGQAFGWCHPTWNGTGCSDLDLSVVQAERGAGKTIYWLVHSVAPAFKNLCASGVIRDPEQFLKEYFSPQ